MVVVSAVLSAATFVPFAVLLAAVLVASLVSSGGIFAYVGGFVGGFFGAACGFVCGFLSRIAGGIGRVFYVACYTLACTNGIVQSSLLPKPMANFNFIWTPLSQKVYADSCSSLVSISSSTSHFFRIVNIVFDPKPARTSCLNTLAAAFDLLALP